MQQDPAFSQACAWAQSQLAGGADCEALVAMLMNQGWPELPARQILDSALTAPSAGAATAARPVMSYATPAQRQRPVSVASARSGRHATGMMIGGAICVVGIVITAGTYASASHSGGTYTICWGAIVFGFIRFIRGFAGWIGGG